MADEFLLFSLALVTLALLLRALRRTRSERVLLVIVGEPRISIAHSRRLTPFILAMLIATVVLLVLALSGLIPYFAMLGTPVLAVIAGVLALGLIMASMSEGRIYLALINVARSRSCDWFFRFIPPGDAEGQEELAREVSRLILRGGFTSVVVILPDLFVWWYAVAELIEKLYEVLKASRLPIFALCCWPGRRRDLLSQRPFLAHLLYSKIPVILVEPRYETVVRELLEYLSQATCARELWEHSIGYSLEDGSALILVPCLNEMEPRLQELYPCYPVRSEARRELVVLGAELEGAKKINCRARRRALTILLFELDTLFEAERVRVIRSGGNPG